MLFIRTAARAAVTVEILAMKLSQSGIEPWPLKYLEKPYFRNQDWGPESAENGPGKGYFVHFIHFFSAPEIKKRAADLPSPAEAGFAKAGTAPSLKNSLGNRGLL